MAETRQARKTETREADERPKAWVQPELLPQPNPEPGYVFRYIRIESMGKTDASNFSAKLREGWVPVKQSEQPHIISEMTAGDRYAENIVIGGLLLCKIPQEIMDQREEFYRNRTKAQMESVDNNFMRENDPRMPLFTSRKSQVRFGQGK